VTPGAASGRYARALFDVVLKEGDDTAVEAVQAQVKDFATLFTSEPLAHILANPGIPASKKKAVATALIDRAGGIAPPLAKLIVILAEKDRLTLLPGIARAYTDRVMVHRKIVRGDVTTAVPLTPERLRGLEEELAKATGRQVVLEARVDPSIIGGVITRLGSTVYDGSVTTQLQKMKQALIEAGQ
jgi:F-type H+-transporting ATPase subunit delta